MASPMILALLSNLNTRVATNETNIAANTTAINTNKGLFDTHTADNTKHWTTQDRQNFDRVVHFKGYYTTKTALEQAYPTGQTGDYAIVGATDTVWAWDDTTNKWINTAQQGVVISVNGRTGEVILTKTDVGLSNVDNTADVNKPISTLQQAALDNKANKGLITSAQADSATLKSGIYYLNSEYTIKDDVDVMYWTIIHSCGVDKSSGTGVLGETAYGSQIWINYTTGGSGKIYYRRQEYNYTTHSHDWSEFKEIMTNTDFEDLKTDIETNTNSILGLNIDKANRGHLSDEDIDDLDKGSGIYTWSGDNYSLTIDGNEYIAGTVIIGAETDSSSQQVIFSELSQIFIPHKAQDTKIFIRRTIFDSVTEETVWDNFKEISTNGSGNMEAYKGYFSSLVALQTAFPTATDGDFAIVDTSFYIWNSTVFNWIEISGGGSGGAVTSVNNKTGDVVLTKNDIGLTNVDNTADTNKNVNSAKTLTNARTIDGISFDGSSNITHYCTCTTAAETAIKIVNCASSFNLVVGAHIRVNFTNANSITATKLNVNNTGDIAIKANYTSFAWRAGEILDFIYDGTNWVIPNLRDADANHWGVVRLATSAASNGIGEGASAKMVSDNMTYIVTGADVYYNNHAYSIGDKVRCGSFLYECIVAIPSGESFNINHWKQLNPLQTQIDSLLGNLYDSFDEYSIGQPYAEGSLVIYEGKLYKCIEAMSSSGIWNSTQWEPTTLIRILNEFPIKMGASKTANFLDSYLNVVGTYNTKDGTLTVPEVVETRGTIIRGNATETSVFDSIVFPETVTFTNRIEMSYYGAYCDVEDPTQPIFIIDFSPNTFSITDLSTGLPIVTYESLGSDAGYVYTRTSSDDYFDIGTTVEFFSGGGTYQWTDGYGAFLQVEVNE